MFGAGVMFHGNELLSASVVPLRDYKVEIDSIDVCVESDCITNRRSCAMRCA
jgi:hypothetical protein